MFWNRPLVCYLGPCRDSQSSLLPIALGAITVVLLLACQHERGGSAQSVTELMQMRVRYSSSPLSW